MLMTMMMNDYSFFFLNVQRIFIYSYCYLLFTSGSSLMIIYLTIMVSAHL
jgi:hypothetical protein